jgi:hypothetical protein
MYHADKLFDRVRLLDFDIASVRPVEVDFENLWLYIR